MVTRTRLARAGFSNYGENDVRLDILRDRNISISHLTKKWKSGVGYYSDKKFRLYRGKVQMK